MKKFDYADLDEEVADEMKAAESRVTAVLDKQKRAHADQVAAIFEIGRELLAIKAKLHANGERVFTRWVETEFPMTHKTACRYMTVAEKLGDKSELVSNLSPTKLYELAGLSDYVLSSVFMVITKPGEWADEDVSGICKGFVEQEEALSQQAAKRALKKERAAQGAPTVAPPPASPARADQHTVSEPDDPAGEAPPTNLVALPIMSNGPTVRSFAEFLYTRLNQGGYFDIALGMLDQIDELAVLRDAMHQHRGPSGASAIVR